MYYELLTGMAGGGIAKRSSSVGGQAAQGTSRPLQFDRLHAGMKNWDGVNRGAPAQGEMDMRQATRPDSPSGESGTIDTTRALAPAYGAPADMVQREVVDKANAVRAASPEEYGMAPVPATIRYDNTGDSLARSRFASQLASDVLQSGGDGSEEALSNGVRSRFAAEYPAASRDMVRQVEEEGAQAFPVIDPDNVAGSVLKGTYDGGRQGMYTDMGVYVPDGNRDTPLNVSDVPSQVYNGLYNPFTGVDTRYMSTAHSTYGHETGHAANNTFLTDENGNSYDGALTLNLQNSMRPLDGQFPSQDDDPTYNSSSVEEATQAASNAKRVAYNEFYRNNGRFPKGEAELRKAYQDIMRYTVPGNGNTFSGWINRMFNRGPRNSEHGRMINEMVPTDPSLTPQQRQSAYDANAARFIDAMLKKDKNGNFYQDALVRNDSVGGTVKSASAGPRSVLVPLMLAAYCPGSL